MNQEDLLAEIKIIISNFPKLKTEVMDLYQLALDEIEEGSSETHECELCISDITELVEEAKNERHAK